MDKTIKERADDAIYEPQDGHPLKACEVVAFASGYERGATEQEEIEGVRIKKLEEALKAYRAFCYNIINGMFIDDGKAAIEQLEYIKANFSKDFDWDTLEE